MITTETIFRHYGADKFDPNKVKPIKNRKEWNKPSGGFWASLASQYSNSWYDWCKHEDFETEKLKSHFDFKLKEKSRILEINNANDEMVLKDFLRKKFPSFLYMSNENKPGLDFENNIVDWDKLSERYDAVWIRGGSDYVLYQDFYGWDCDSIVIFRANIVEEI